MRWIYKSVLLLLLSFMLRSPLLRLYQTTRQFVKVIPEVLEKPNNTPSTAANMSKPSGLIANKGLELLTFGTPNGMRNSDTNARLDDMLNERA